MGKLAWDQTGQREYQNGISHCVLYTMPGRGDPDKGGFEKYVTLNRSQTYTPEARTAMVNYGYASEFTDVDENAILYIFNRLPTPSQSSPAFPDSLTWDSTNLRYYKCLGYVPYADRGNAGAWASIPGFQDATITVTATGTGVELVETFPTAIPESQVKILRYGDAILAYTPVQAVNVIVGEDELSVDDFKMGECLYYGVPWNGITGITESPDGAEANDLWADNMKYAAPRSVETFGATVEAYTYPDEFGICDGTANAEMGIRFGQQDRKPFCLSYRTEIGTDSDDEAGYLLHLVYGCAASPSERAYQTINDSPDAVSFSWEMDTTPVKFQDAQFDSFKPVSTITIDSRRAFALSLQTLEEILYGSDDHPAVMPPPDVVLRCFDWRFVLGKVYSHTSGFADADNYIRNSAAFPAGTYSVSASTFVKRPVLYVSDTGGELLRPGFTASAFVVTSPGPWYLNCRKSSSEGLTDEDLALAESEIVIKRIADGENPSALFSTQDFTETSEEE